MDITEEQEYFRRHAQALGIPVDKPEDQLSQLVNIAIEDLNPENVLKNCEYLYVKIVNVSSVGELLNLPTMGNKQILCLRCGYQIEGFSLERVFMRFEEVYCSKCKDKKPMAKSWKWSREWQQLQDEKMKDD
ncbi:hypothetical protein ES703_28768 [subsurface metagenome]